MYEELGGGFTLLAFGADDSAVQGLEDAAGTLRLPLKVVRDTFAAEREAYEARLTLVRPDQYVVWADDEAPANPAAVLKRATGR